MPLVSILVASKNQASYLIDMISALKAQSFQDFEVVVVDANSVDESPKIFTQYQKVKFIQLECDANAAYIDALKNSTGKYIMIATTSDFLYNNRWIETAVKRLESDDELSCVWGSGIVVGEDGDVKSLWAEHYLISTPPSKNEYLYFWLYMPYLPELNYVVRAEVFKFCIELKTLKRNIFNVNNIFLFNFTSCGFLQAYIPAIASAGRVHGNSLTSENKRLDRAQSVSFFKLRLKFIFCIYIKGQDFQFRNHRFETLDHYQLDNFFIFISKLNILIFKDIVRKILKKILIFIYKI